MEECLRSFGMFVLDQCVIHGTNCINILVSKLLPGSAAKKRPQHTLTPMSTSA